MELQIIITVNFKGWSFEVYKENGNVKIHLADQGTELSIADWHSLTTSVNDSILDVRDWRGNCETNN